ncbi:MAG: hypothetical protein HC850_11630 [Rhodomicrobium sp.]|nr:hypothetical protein [Rhodomicrobium sp.]
MEKLAVWVFAGLLGYICLMLTSINSKIDAIYDSGTQYAVLNEVKQQSFNGGEVQQVAFRDQVFPQASSINTAFMLVGVISIFVSWHLSRLYYNHQWSRRILKKNFAQYDSPYIMPSKRETIHIDQDCAGDPPPEDGRIKVSWLPMHVRGFYAGRGGIGSAD